MTCEEANNLIHALIDGQIAPADEARLERHLADCTACREEAQLAVAQDAQLKEAFAGHRVAAERVADRVVMQLPRRRKISRGAPWWSLVAAAAAGFVIAWGVFHQKEIAHPIAMQPATVPTKASVAHLTLATGAVECRPAGAGQWAAVPTGGAIAAGTELRTAWGVRCEVHLTDGSDIRLDENTQLAIVSPRRYELASGQAWSSVAHQAGEPFEATSSKVVFTALGTQFDLCAKADETTLTVVEGSVRASSGKSEVVVPSGHEMLCPSGHLGDPQPVQDLALATRWVNEILILKGRDNPELNRRINDLFAQIGDSKMSFMYEDEIRALGDHCVIPLTRYIESPRSQGQERKRATAAKIVADVAPPWAIPELMRLLGDENGEIRARAATALQRLTGQTLGRSPEQWRADSLYTCTPSVSAWEEWWEKNKGRYPGIPEIQNPKSKIQTKAKAENSN